MMKLKVLSCFLVFGIFMISCNKDIEKQEASEENLSKFSKTSKSFLNQTLPEKKAEKFAPKMISPLNKRHSKISVSPDGFSLYWSFYGHDEKIRKVAFHEYKNEKWGPEKIADFHSKLGSDSPCFWGNNRIVFHAKRKITLDSKDIIDDFWVVKKKEGKWDEPKQLGLNKFGKIHKMPMLSIADNGNIYFNGTFDKGAYKLGIYMSKFTNSKYTKPVLLPELINSKYLDWCPFIANDESYLIFSSDRHGKKDRGPDLYISFKDKDGNWLDPVNMGNQINSVKEERFASVTADGKVMFFMRGINKDAEYFWIDGGIIDELKLKNSEQVKISKNYNINLKLAEEAVKKKDYKAALFYLGISHEMAPNHPILNYQIARINALQGNKNKALSFLNKSVRLGYGLKFPGEKWDISNDPAFKKYYETPEFKFILKEVEEIEKPINNISQIFKIKERDLVPEGMAYDSVDDKFYFSSLKKNKIIRTDRHGNIKNFTDEGQDGLGSVLGMEVDEKNRILWVCSDFNSRSATNIKNPKEWAGVFKFDIKTGKLIKKYIISFFQKRKHFFNDLTIGKKGDVFITDNGFSSIYKISKKTDELELFIKTDEFVSPNGITLSADEKTIYMADWPVGIYSIDIKNKKHSLLTSQKAITTYGIDGLYFYKNSLIAIQNGMERISRFFLNKKGDQITHLEVLESNNPILDIPTTGALYMNEFYFFANTPLYYFKTDGSLDMEKVTDLKIMKTSLKD